MLSLNFRQSKIFYEDSDAASSKPVLICVHGFLENAQMWNFLQPHFKQNYRIICIDLPGHGQTKAIGYIHTMAMLAEIIKHLLEKLNIKTAHFIGHSLGGYVLLALAETNLDCMQQIILLNSSPFADDESRKKDRNRAIKMVQKYPQAFVSMAVKNLFLPQMHLLHETEIEQVVEQAKQSSIQGIINTIKGMRDRKQYTKILTKKKIKVNLISGQNDPISNLKVIEDLAKKNNLNLKVLPGGHMSYIEALPELITHLKTIL